MSNMLANRLTIEAQNIREIIMFLLTFDELGDEADFDFNKVSPIPKNVKDTDKWTRENWGCRENALYTNVDFEKGTIEFNTLGGCCLKVIEKIATAFPNAVLTYEYADEQPGYNIGKYVLINGKIAVVVDIESFSKEAYEQYFNLWGGDNRFIYDKETDNYVFKTKNLKFYEFAIDCSYTKKIFPILRTYRNNGRLAIEMVDESYELIDYLTVNIDYPMSRSNTTDLAFIDTNNVPWAESFIEKCKLGKKTGFYGMSGFCTYPEYRFDLSKLNMEKE